VATTKKKASKKKTTKRPARAAKVVKKAAAGAKASPPKYGQRADLGAPIDGFFAKQPAPLRSILEELRRMIDEIAPDAASSIKWGMPFYEINGETVCAIAGHKSHVNLILAGPPGTFADPDGLLSGEGKTGRHLKLTSLEQLPKKSVRAWLKTAAERARTG
jgi:hypothetical protein